MTKTIRIRVGSRASRLARVQVEEVGGLLKKAGIECAMDPVVYETQGDKDRTTPLTDNPMDNFFTDTLDRAVIAGEIDVAVHSAKDLPECMPPELEIYALTAALDETDALVARSPLADLPAGAVIGTSSLLRQQQLQAIRPDLKLKDIRGNIEQRIAQMEQGDYDGVIIATCALKRLGMEDRIVEILPYEATPLQGQLAIVGRRDEMVLAEIFGAIDVRRRYGRVRLVGAGPGDPGLITLKGVQALAGADVVYYDYLVPASLLSYAPKAEKIYVGKRKGEHSLPQAELNQLLRDAARQGREVVRLKGGDPFIFGRGPDEIAYLSAYHIPVEVIPGVSSATGIPSRLGVPLTARDVASSVAFVSGHQKNESRGPAARVHVPDTDTVVFLMGLTKLEEIVQALGQKGWKPSTPVMIISRGTTLQERVLSGTLADIVRRAEEEKPSQPALIIVGNVVRFFDERLYRRETVLYLGTNPDKYRALGKLLHLPVIEITPRSPDQEELGEMKVALDKAGWVVFTSRFAVESFFAIMEQNQWSVELVKSKSLAVIGKETAAVLNRRRLRPEVIARENTSRGLLDAMGRATRLKGEYVFFPRSALPNSALKEGLEKAGATVVEWPVYENRKPPKRDVDLSGVRKVVFTSPSTVKNFLEDYGPVPSTWQILCKGPVTRQALKEAGYESEVLFCE